MVVGQDMQDMGLQNWTVYRYIKVALILELFIVQLGAVSIQC